MLTETPLTQASEVRRGRLGWWFSDDRPPELGAEALTRAIQRVGRPVHVIEHDGGLGVGHGGTAVIGSERVASVEGERNAYSLAGFAPALSPEQLGDAAFRRTHGLRYAYVAGAMANGIASERMVEAMGRAGMIGFFGAAGCDLPRIEAAIDRIQGALPDGPYGFNLIHSPSDPQLEAATVDLYRRRGVRLVSASAYLDLTLPLIRYRVAGIRRGAKGEVVAANRVIGKVSRVEVARKFFSPPPPAMLEQLVQAGEITTEQAALASRIPVAEDLTAEADSGGHTDNRPAISLFPTMLALRDELQAKHGYTTRLRVGMAGGIATPASSAAAFSMGAAYVLTGSINQACVEAGTSTAVREMLAGASQADVIMAPAADMFEMGVKVQVLKWGTMFAVRAQKLYDLYRTYDSLEALPASQRTVLERDYFRCSLAEAWAQTRAYFEQNDPSQITRAERDPRHEMALVFRSYLGRSSNWANAGEPSRKVDYQIWCGPAMGAFNEWVRGSFMERADRREVVPVAMNLLIGAAALMRVAWLRSQGVALPADAERFAPRPVRELEARAASEDGGESI